MNAKKSLVDPEGMRNLYSPRESKQVQRGEEKSQVRPRKRRICCQFIMENKTSALRRIPKSEIKGKIGVGVLCACIILKVY